MPAAAYALSHDAAAPARADDDTDAAGAGLVVDCCCCRTPGDGGATAPPADAHACLRTHGAVVLRGCLSPDDVASASCALQPFLHAVAAGWDASQDRLALASWRSWGVTRTPRVNAGKKNLHFDPELRHVGDGTGRSSPPHGVLQRLAQAGGFARVLASYWECGEHGVCLTETGVSVTRPGGSGMELHADGGRGEATVLLSLAHVPHHVGALALVPGSHDAYSTDATRQAEDASGGEHEQEPAGEESSSCDGQTPSKRRRRVAWYCYAPGDAMLIDARTLHGASDNMSMDEWRVVCWFIYNRTACQEDGADA